MSELVKKVRDILYEKYHANFNTTDAAIEILELVSQSRWISVDARLPEKGKTVLCYGFSGENKENPDEKEMDTGDLQFNSTVVFYGACNGYVTHWQPLPKAPPQDDKTD